MKQEDCWPGTNNELRQPVLQQKNLSQKNNKRFGNLSPDEYKSINTVAGFKTNMVTPFKIKSLTNILLNPVLKNNGTKYLFKTLTTDKTFRA